MKSIAMRTALSWLLGWVCFCAGLGAVALHAQEHRQAPDTAAILQLLEKGDSLSNVQPDEAYDAYTRALQLSRSIPYHKGTVMALTRTGNWYFGNDMSLAIQYGRQALQLYEEKEMADVEIKAPLDMLLAEAYDERGIVDSSAYFFYILTNEMEGERRMSPAFTTNVYIKLAVFWIHMNYDTASTHRMVKLYVDNARRVAEGLPESSAARRNVYFLQALGFQATHQFDSSRYYFELFLEKSPRLGLPRKMSALLNIASTWLYTNRPDKALDYIEQMEALAHKPGHEAATAYFINETSYLRAYAWFMQERYSTTIPLLQQFLARSEGKGKQLRFEMMDAHRMLAGCYERMGLYKEALEESKIQRRQQDSLSRKDKLDMVNRLEMRYRLTQKDKTLALQKLTIAEERDKARKRNFWMGIIALVVAVLTITGMLWQRNSLQKQKLQAEKLNGIQKEIEITRLQATVTGEERERKRLARELHDGVGGILAAARMSLSLFAQKQPPATAAGWEEGLQLMEEAAIELRKTAHNMLPDVLETKGLEAAVRSFVSKISCSYSAALVVQSYGAEKRYAISWELAIYRIVQELVQQMLKHTQAAQVIIQIDFEPAGVTVTIEDDGIVAPEYIQPAASVSDFAAVEERVRAAGGSMDIKSSPGAGTSIYLEFTAPA